MLVANVSDRVILARLLALATRRGLSLVLVHDLGPTPDDEAPVAIVTELESPDAVERISAYRLRWPTTLLAGSIGVPDQERWHGALAAGADLVGRLPDAPGGSIVVIRVAARLNAIRDECQHAGTSLADGTLVGRSSRVRDTEASST